MDSTRKILLAVVVIIIMLILINNVRLMHKSANIQRQAASKTALMHMDEPHKERIAFTPTTHIPIYDANGRLGIIADYSSVPYELGKKMKPLEGKDVIIVDDKSETTNIKPPTQLQTRSGAESDITEGEKKLNADASVVTGIMLATPAEIDEQEAIKDAAKIAIMATSDPAINQYEQTLSREHEFIKTLPVDNTCRDFMPELCQQWSKNNECIVNPEFMLKNCPSSCFTCSMTDGEKNMLSNMYNKRDPINCVYHGGYSIPGGDKVFE